MGRLFLTFFLFHLCHLERLSLDGSEGFLSFLLRSVFPLRSGEGGITIHGCQYPIRLRLEVLDLLLAVYDEGEGWRLHAADAEHLTVLPIPEGIEAGGIHTQQPVADGTGETCQVEGLVIGLVFQVRKALADRLVSHRGDPQAFHRTGGLCFLHHPALDEFSFLSGITAVHDTIGRLHQFLDDGKLFLDAVIVNQFDAEALGYHRQLCQCPRSPGGCVVTRLFQGTEMSEGPSHLVAVTFHITVMGAICSQDARNIPSDTRFLSDTYNHFFFSSFWLIVSSARTRS